MKKTDYLKDMVIIILLLLYVIFPDFLPIILDDIIAFVMAMGIFIKDVKGVLR